MGLRQLGKFNNQGYKFTTVGGRMANQFRMMTHGAKGFRMEMLGIMFFGMSLYRIFTGLIRKSNEWMGVTEIFSTALGLLFLPLSQFLQGAAMKFLKWVNSLSPAQQKVVNVLVAAMIALGGFFTVLGTLALGIGSLILVFGKLFGVAAPLKALGGIISAIFGGITVTLLAVVAIIIAIAIGMYVAWTENFMGMKQIITNWIEGVKGAFAALWTIIKSIFGFWIAVFKGDWDGAFQHIKNGFVAFKDFLINTIQIMVNAVAAVVIGIIRIFKFVVDSVIGFFQWLYDKLVGHSIIPDIVNGIIDWFKKLPGAIWNVIKDIGKKIANAFTDAIPSWMIGLLKKGVNIGGKIRNFLGFAKGGIVPGPKGSPVPAIVHGGETITPAGGRVGGRVGGSMNVTINANVSNDYDVRRLADQLKRYWTNDFEKLTQSRGVS